MTYRLFPALVAVLSFALPAEYRAGDAVKYLAKESDIIVQFDIRAILDSAVVKKHALDFLSKEFKENEELKAVMAGLGLDPFRDLIRLTVGGIIDPTNTTASVIVLEGKFDAKKIEGTIADFAKKSDGSLSLVKEDGKTFIKINVPQMPEPVWAFIVDDKTIVAGDSKDTLLAALNQASMGKPELGKEMAAAMGRLNKNASMSMVILTKEKLGSLPLPDPDLAKTLEKITSIRMEMTTTTDVALSLNLSCENEEGAKEIADKTSQLLTFANQALPGFTLQRPELKPITEVVKNIKSGAKGTEVYIDIVMPADTINKLAEAMKGIDN